MLVAARQMRDPHPAQPARPFAQTKQYAVQNRSVCWFDIGDERSAAGEFWWTWSGSNRRPLPCHEIQRIVSYRRYSTYEPAQPAKTALWAVFATKMRQTFQRRVKGLAVWDRPNNASNEIHCRKVPSKVLEPGLSSDRMFGNQRRRNTLGWCLRQAESLELVDIAA